MSNKIDTKKIEEYCKHLKNQIKKTMIELRQETTVRLRHKVIQEARSILLIIFTVTRPLSM